MALVSICAPISWPQTYPRVYPPIGPPTQIPVRAHCPQTFICSCTHTLLRHPSRSPRPAGLALGKLQFGGQTGPTWARQSRAGPISDPAAAPLLPVSLCFCLCLPPRLCGPPLSRSHPTDPEGQPGDSRTRAALPAARDKHARGPGGLSRMGPAPHPGPAHILAPPRILAPPPRLPRPRGAFPLGRSAPTQQWKSCGPLR